MGLLSSTVLAFAGTVVLALALRPVAVRLRITDKPGGRKQRVGEIRLVGGIAMFIGILVAAMTAVQTRADGLCWSPPRSSSLWVSSTTLTVLGCRHALRYRPVPRSS